MKWHFLAYSAHFTQLTLHSSQPTHQHLLRLSLWKLLLTRYVDFEAYQCLKNKIQNILIHLKEIPNNTKKRKQN